MLYTAKNIDVAKFEEALRKSRESQQQKLLREKEKAQAYFDGWEDCMDRVIDMLHCSNYEKAEVKEESQRG